MAVHDAVPSAPGKVGNDKHCRVPEVTAEGSATLTLKDSKGASWRPSSDPRNAPAWAPESTGGSWWNAPRHRKPGRTRLNTPAWHLLQQLHTHGLWSVPCDSGACRVTPVCAM